MKKITLLILLFSSIASFSQEQVLLDIERLLTNSGNGKIKISNSSNTTLYESFGAVNNYGQIINVTASSFPLTITFTPGINAGCSATQTYSYTYSDYLGGRHFIGGCAPEYFNVVSPYINQLTAATSTVGVCENIQLLSGSRHYYSVTGNAPWTQCSSTFTPASILGSNYRGPLKIRSEIDTYYANPKVTMLSKVISYTIIGCSPELDGQPLAANTKCKYESSGSVTLKFQTELNDGDKFLFNIFKSGVFDKSVFASKSEVINKSFTLTGLAEGSYYIKYQSQTTTNNGTLVGDSAITTNTFNIGSPQPLTFTISPLQPNCNGEQGFVQVTASGGTSPYYYMVDSETILQKHLLTSNPIPLSEGDHNITVIDSNNCIEK